MHLWKYMGAKYVVQMRRDFFEELRQMLDNYLFPIHYHIETWFQINKADKQHGC